MVGIFESRRGEVEVLTAVQIGQQDFVEKRQIVVLADFQIKILSLCPCGNWQTSYDYIRYAL